MVDDLDALTPDPWSQDVREHVESPRTGWQSVSTTHPPPSIVVFDSFFFLCFTNVHKIPINPLFFMFDPFPVQSKQMVWIWPLPLARIMSKQSSVILEPSIYPKLKNKQWFHPIAYYCPVASLHLVWSSLLFSAICLYYF